MMNVTELARLYLARCGTRFGAYMALQAALMRHYMARGGSAAEFCERLSPAFHRRYAALLLEERARVEG